MGKRYVVALGVAAAALASFVLPAQGGPVSTAQGETRTMASGAAGVTVKVKMVDDKFKPKKVSVSKGTKIKWVNKGSNPHTTTGKGWDETLSPGQTYSRRFKKAGIFKYHCSFHSEMVGKVVVTS